MWIHLDPSFYSNLDFRNMELVDRNQSTVLKQTMKNSVNVVSNKFSRIDSQLINEKLNKKWTMKTLLKKSKPKSEWINTQ
ncbi:unnamed protein product [Heterobilharzia americana]|nr:unnamed protein product [Heterobilharzia americana]